jgi:hypothetical protein
MKIKELLADVSKWTQKVPARNADGASCNVNEGAVCWCLWGAAVFCYDRTFDDPAVRFHDVRNKIEAVVLGGNMVTWNDAPERTFEEVKALVERLDV